ncbi:MAG: EAL domain-containing protein [Alphaproteobacteria bacterium]|nr:EAL domain-containing protein [Alphaproteobacteria bacterium]
MSEPEFSLFLVKKSFIDKADDRFKTIMRWRDVDLFRQPLSFLFPADAHDRVERLLDRDDVSIFQNVMFPQVPLRLKTGGYINFDMRVTEKSGGERLLEFFKPGRGEQPQASDGAKAEAPADMYSFFNFVEDLLASPFEGDLDLTMVSMDALKDNSDAGLTDEEKASARTEFEANLQRHAVGGKVGKLDEASYGLLTATGFDEDAFDLEMQNVAARLNIAPEKLALTKANMAIDDRDVAPEKLHQALHQARGVFVGEIEDEQGIEKLSGVIDGIEHNRKLIQDAIKRYKYRTSPRMVADNLASVSIAVLQQGKVNLEGQIRRPDDIIALAEHPDISIEHDLAQLEDLIRMRVRKPADEREKPDYYELCRSTMIQDRFTEELEVMLGRHGEVPDKIGFRIKGMPPVRRGGLHWDALNKLAALGHPIWIDRFGDAVVAPEALKCLKGGMIEMPPPLMKKLAGHFDGKEMMSQLVATWQAMNVRVVSADLPDYDMKTLAQELGITVAVEDAPEMMTS